MSEDWVRPIVHWELQARDPELMRNFYGKMFNWPIGDGPLMGFPSGIGGPEPGPAGHIIKGERSGLAPYIQVRDMRASMEQAKALGGAVLSEPFDVPGGPTVVRIADPEGNGIVLVQQ